MMGTRDGDGWFAIIEGTARDHTRTMQVWPDSYSDADAFFHKVADQADQFQVKGRTPTVIRVTFINTSEVED